MQYMTESNWREFADKFPRASAWLNYQTLVNELTYLRSIVKDSLAI